jgi:flagellar biosynthesis GTPase FlhF
VNDTPRHVLCNLIQKYGTSLCDDRGRCSGLLHDFCGAHKAEIAVLLTALEETVPLALITQSKTTSPRMLIGRLVKRLQDDRHLTDEAAHWAVESWALALGIIQSTDVSQPKSKPKPPSSRAEGTGPKPLSESPIALPEQDPQSHSSRERKKGRSWGIRLITLMFTVLAAIVVIALKIEYDNNERVRLEAIADAESERQAKQEAAEQTAERQRQIAVDLERKRAEQERQKALEEAEREAERERQEAEARRLQAEEEARQREKAEQEQLKQKELKKSERSVAQLLSGKWQLQWQLDNTWYRGVLVMNGITGMLRLTYLHPLYQQNVSIDQDIVLQFNTNKGFFYLRGSNPRFSGTSQLRMDYVADSFRLLQEEDGTMTIIETCSAAGCAKVYAELSTFG